MKKIFLMVIVCLLVYTIVNAESAWVLWTSQYFTDEEPGVWSIDSAFPSYELCIKEVNFKIEAMRKDSERKSSPDWIVIPIPSGVIVDLKYATGVRRNLKYLWNCLPDTIDPRK